MNNPRHLSFEKVYEGGDDRLFQELMQGFVGAECTGCRETYAQGLVLDIGKLATIPLAQGKQPVKKQGEWVVASWGCHVLIEDPLEGLNASSEKDFGAVMAVAQRLVGVRVADVVMHPPELSLVVDFLNQIRLTFQTDSDVPDLDQWYIQLPSGLSVSASGYGRWSLEEDSRAPRDDS